MDRFLALGQDMALLWSKYALSYLGGIRSTLLLALAVSAAAGPLAGPAVEKLFWFFTYRFTAAPLLALLPVFLLLGCVVPLASYRAAARQTVVERLRAAD